MSDSNGRPLAPKGILKNRQKDDTSTTTGYGQAKEGSLLMDYLGQSGPTNSWDNLLPRSDPVVKSEPAMGLDRNLRQKLNEFISRKGELLFRPLGSDEAPMNEDKGTHRSTQDHCGIVPSLDYFLKLDSAERTRYFFNSVAPGDIVIAKLVTKALNGLHLSLLCMEGGRGFLLEELNIIAFCPTSQMISAVDPKNPNKIFAEGDLVRCEILRVTPDTEKLIAGMKGNALSPEMQHSFQLGLIFPADLPQEFSMAMAEKKLRGGHKSNYQDMLINSLGFRNPNNIAHLASAMGILNNKCTLMTGLSGVFPLNQMATELRRTQNGQWAHGHVAEGIRHLKAGTFTEAFQCLNKALIIDAENVEGLVARGALYANKASYEKAIADFESALKYNSGHFNARKYLAETLVAYGKFLESTGKIEEAVASYSKCLAARPDQTEAKDALWSLYARTEKLDASKMPSGAAAKTLELKEKLKILLKNDLADDTIGSTSAKVQGDAKHSAKGKKAKKEKKKRGHNSSMSDISSDSESESESESSSSDDESRRSRKKKKSKKRRSKKAKKSTSRSRRDTLEKEPSMSPLSRRLDSGNNAFPGSTYGMNESMRPQWGNSENKVSTLEQDDSKLSGGKKEKKRSKKGKEKRKRKRRSTESSSSASESSDQTSEKRKSTKSGTISSLVDPIIPDLGDLEEKLSAYYSKVEQGKVESLIQQPEIRRTNDIQVTLEQNLDKYSRINDAYENIVRKIEVRPKETENSERYFYESELKPEPFHGNEESRLGKIELRTDEYGNFIHAENIVRTVMNDTPEHSRPKFEMKFRPQAPQPPATAAEKSEPGSKWRTVGSTLDDSSYTVTRLDGSAVTKPDPQDLDQLSRAKPYGLDPSLPNPLSPDRKSRGREEGRNYRGRRSRSRSRSSSGSIDRRYKRRRSRSRSLSKGRSHSKSKSRSRTPGSRRRSRSRNSRSPVRRRRSRSRSQDYRRRSHEFGRNNYRGRGGSGPTRFFRGFRSDRGMRRPYGSRGFGSGQGFQSSRMRNTFRRSRSRSRSPRDSKSRSGSPRGRGRDRRSRSKNKEQRNRSRGDRSKSVTPTKTRLEPSNSTKKDDDSKDRGSEIEIIEFSNKVDKSKSTIADDLKNENQMRAKEAANSKIQIGTLTTTKAAEVEELLDQRNAQKKEEMRERNPDFFRPV